MHVLIYYPGDLCRPTGTPIRAWNLVQALSRLDVEISLLAIDASQNFMAGCRFISVRSGSGKLQQILELRSIIRQIKPDLLLSITHVALSVATISALLCHIPHVIDLHGIWLEAMKAEGLVAPWQRWKITAFERLFLPRCSGATVVSNPLREYYQGLQRHIEVVPGGVDLRRFNPDVSPAPEIQALRAANPQGLVVGYIGNLRPYQGVQELFDVAVRIVKRDPTFQFVFIGEGSLKTPLLCQLQKNNLDGQICFLPQKPYAEIPAYLAACDLLVVPRPSNRLNDSAFASKLPEYLAMGKVVIATDVGDAKLLVRNGETGYVIPPNDPTVLEEAILAQKDNPDRLRIGERAFQIVKEEHTWDARAQALVRFFGSLA